MLPVSIDVRVNTLKITSAECAARLAQRGWAVHPLAWCPEAFSVTGATMRALTDLADHTEGLFFIQNRSSLLPVLALNPQPGQTVLDLCAAPGGKTTHLAARMRNTGLIIANDISQPRVYRLAALLRQYGVACARTTRLAGQRVWRRYPDYFDAALVDAPCSMRGTATPSPSAVKSLAKQQKFLLKSALSATRPGGVIIYSTCTTTAEENEGVIAWLLEKHPGQVEVEPFDLPGAPFAPALLADPKGRGFPPPIARARRVPPTDAMEGFFIARLRKSPNE
jgi:16S rRNA (cytosine1407-C5)-methyltransferase